MRGPFHLLTTQSTAEAAIITGVRSQPLLFTDGLRPS